MKTMQDFHRLVLVLALALFGFSILVHQANADVVLVAHPDVPDASLSAADIENLFLGKRKTLPSGESVKVVTLKDGDAHDAFLSAYVNRSASQFSAFWKRKIVDGTGIPPKSFDSEAELIAHVKANSGTLGYVSNSTPADGVKVIAVE